ncbi:uncharacterized protein [Prorops nasuta]|uniref:uncharacterized protein n=1 Tax=Prorops nasuta TaxID=863751 RepID=UPI0034CFD33D
MNNDYKSARKSNYALVVFVETLNKACKSIDIVPSKWLQTNKYGKTGFSCPFPKDFTEISSKDFHKLVKNFKSPNQKWKLYDVEIKGSANNYNEALEKLKRLEQESDVFTSDVEKSELFKKKKDLLKGPITKNKNFQTSLKAAVNLAKPINVMQHISRSDNSNRLEDQDNSKESLSFDSLSHNDIEDLYSSEENESNIEKSQTTAEKFSSPTLTDKQLDDHKVILHKLSQDIRELNDTISSGIRKLTSQISTLQSEVISYRIETQKLMELGQRGSRIYADYTHTSNLSLPFKTLPTFEEFDLKLKSDETIRKEIDEIIWSLIDTKKELVKSVTNILAKFFTGPILNNFTASRPVPGKSLFKDTELYKCAYGQINYVFKNINKDPVTEEMFCKAVGRVINNSKDWDGQRRKRNKQLI